MSSGRRCIELRGGAGDDGRVASRAGTTALPFITQATSDSISLASFLGMRSLIVAAAAHRARGPATCQNPKAHACSAAEQLNAGIDEGRIGNLAAIVYTPWYFQALTLKTLATQDSLSPPRVVQKRPRGLEKT